MSEFVFNEITRQLDIAGTSGSLATPVSVANGGTGSTGAQAAINTLTEAPSHNVGEVFRIQSDGDAGFSIGTGIIPEYVADPTTPLAGDTWILRTDGAGTAGSPLGLLLVMTQTVGITPTYSLSYKSSSGTIFRTALS